MKFNFWLVILLVLMPLFILVAGLSAAAGAFDSPLAWGAIGAVLVAGVGAARMASDVA